jgi:hypothetical protein
MTDVRAENYRNRPARFTTPDDIPVEYRHLEKFDYFHAAYWRGRFYEVCLGQLNTGG